MKEMLTISSGLYSGGITLTCCLYVWVCLFESSMRVFLYVRWNPPSKYTLTGWILSSHWFSATKGSWVDTIGITWWTVSCGGNTQGIGACLPGRHRSTFSKNRYSKHPQRRFNNVSASFMIYPGRIWEYCLPVVLSDLTHDSSHERLAVVNRRAPLKSGSQRILIASAGEWCYF